MANKRFSFDDTIEYDKNDLTPDNDFQPSKTSHFEFDDDFSFDDSTGFDEEIDGNDGEKDVKKKKKRKIKIWVIVLLLFLFLIGGFLLYIFVFAGSNDGPVYGDRCASMIAIDEAKLTEAETAIESMDNIQDVAIEVECRKINMTFTFVDNIASADAMAITENAIHVFDDTIGMSKSDGSQYSELLNKANGRNQYDISLILKSNGDTNFPIFGTKKAAVDEITYTGQNVKDQESADRAIQRQAEVDAANEAAENSEN